MFQGICDNGNDADLLLVALCQRRMVSWAALLGKYDSRAEMDYAAFCFTIHPDVAGRPQVLLMLERLIEYINKQSGVEWTTFQDITDDFRVRYPFNSDKRPETI